MRNRLATVVDGLCMVPLTRGHFALCDLSDRVLVERFSWRVNIQPRTFYAVTDVVLNGVKITIKMHRLLMGVEDAGIEVDHKDSDGLNNCRGNLRIANHQENAMNCRLSVDSSSGEKGVTWHKRDKKWQAQIRIGGKKTFLGCFLTKVEAASAYAIASKNHHGIFSRV